MTVYRLSKQQYIKDISGRGAQLAGARWNSKGIALLYTAESRALATIEVAVHIPLGILPTGYFLAIIEVPGNAAMIKINAEDMPGRWNTNPSISATQKIGDEFVKNNKALILQVPSATIQGDHNYLINPAHPDFHLVKIKTVEPFEFDTRLFKN